MNNLDWKKIGLIALFIFTIGVFAFFIYFFFVKTIFLSPTEPAVTDINQIDDGQLPIGDSGNLNRIGDLNNINGLIPSNINSDPTISEPTDQARQDIIIPQTFGSLSSLYPSVQANGEIVYYNTEDGKLYRVDQNGNISEFSSKVFYNVSNISWSPNQNRAILEYPDGSNIVYDFEENKQYTLPKHWTDFSFSATGQQIAFKSIGLDIENRYLAVANYNGSQTKTLERIGGVENKFTVNWSPNNQIVATFTDYRDARRSEIYFIGQNNENFKLMLAEGRGFNGIWSPDGNQMLYSVYSSATDYKPQLWIADTAANQIGNNRRSIDLYTWADKCSFTNPEKIYCAVPQSLPYGIGLDRSVAQNTGDIIYEINLNTGVKKIIADPLGNDSIDEILTVDQNYIIYSSGDRMFKIEL